MSCPPVLFLIFNRPDLTQRVFQRIRDARPHYLFVAADGPRPAAPEDVEKCRKAREVIQVDWDCELHTLYRDSNLGCGVGPASAISWFFENVEHGIILEDDCLPSQSFFIFCGDLLSHFENETNMFAISGTNILQEFDSKYSVVYSYFGGNWGWGTWRRAWQFYDYEMSQWRDTRVQAQILGLLSDRPQFEGVKQIFDNQRNVVTWDFQWFFTRLYHGGLSAVPVRNLVSNIGFGEEATHTFDKRDPLSELQTFDLQFPLRIDPIVRPNRMFDYLNAKKYGFYTNRNTSLKGRLFRVLQRIYG